MWKLKNIFAKLSNFDYFTKVNDIWKLKKEKGNYNG